MLTVSKAAVPWCASMGMETINIAAKQAADPSSFPDRFFTATPPVRTQSTTAPSRVSTKRSALIDGRLLPGRINGFADQERLVHALARCEFLHAAAVHFGNVEVAVLVDAEAGHSPESSRYIATHAPGIQEMPFEIILQHLRCSP